MKIKSLKPTIKMTRYILSTLFMLIIGIGISRTGDRLSNHPEVKKSFGNGFFHPMMVEVIITGIVTDEDSRPIPDVTVSIPGTTIGIVTDLNGKYSLAVPEERNLVS